MYSHIQQLKAQLYSKAMTAEHLGISRTTVSKYWDMTPVEYEKQSNQIRRSHALRKHEPVILGWLREHPGIPSSVVHDWLLEHYKISSSERTTRRLVGILRSEHGIKRLKEPRIRDYEAMDDPHMGQQMQVDFGQKNIRTSDGKIVCVHFVTFVLSHSRYKWGVFQERPFTSKDLILSLQQCFEHMGGKPHELVFDQDSIVTVSENYGDILYTQAFEEFKQEEKLIIYLCRKSDPETKGRIEAVVKYIKINFLSHRLYMGVNILNQSFKQWLERTGNGKVHGTTKKVPAEVFEVERAHLRPVLCTQTNVCNEIISRKVRKDNTILYESNRYSVPLGTYRTEKEVSLRVENDTLIIEPLFGDYEIAKHVISYGKGQLIKNTSHRRNTQPNIEALFESLSEALNHQCDDYLETLRVLKPRYFRDQAELLKAQIDDHGENTVIEAISYCQTLELFGATEVRDTITYLKNQNTEVITTKRHLSLIGNKDAQEVITQKRSLEAYDQIGGEIS